MQEQMEKDEIIGLATEEIIHYCMMYGYENVLDRLCENDFFTAPASTKYHESFAGGLAVHTYRVYVELLDLLDLKYKGGYYKGYSNIPLAFKLALCHDFCKINVYKTEMRNTKDENGKWIQVPYYTFVDENPYGHGEKSVQLAELYGIELSQEEKMAIRWHMGAFDMAVKGGFNISSVFEKYPLALYLHLADMIATYRYNYEKE